MPEAHSTLLDNTLLFVTLGSRAIPARLTPALLNPASDGVVEHSAYGHAVD